MSEALCVIGQREHQATIGYLCGHHFEQLGAMLRDIEDEAALLTASPSMQTRNGNRGATLASHRSPAILNAVVANDPRRGRPSKAVDRYDPWAFDDTASVLDVLHSWARIVREERQLTAPDTVTVSSERDLWTRSLEWIAAQLWVDEAFGEVKGLLGQLRGANGTRADRPYSYCPSAATGEQCTGQVWIHDELQPVWRRYPDRCAQTWEHAPGAAVCDTCGAAWSTPADKARLRRMIDDAATELTRPRTEDGEPMLTAEELVGRGLVSTVSNVRVTAHRRGIVSSSGYYDPRAFSDKATA